MSKLSRRLTVGIDIGGTKLHAVVADPDGLVVARARKKVGKHRDFDSVMQRVDKLVHTACADAGVEPSELGAIGVGAPSPVLPDGTAVHAPNLGWKNAPVGKTIAARLGKPCRVANDCDAGTLAETVYGAAQGARTAVGLFMGTGLGGGIVIDGQLICGDSHQAAEVGHMVVVHEGRRCGCGRRGCLEAYASKTGMTGRLAGALRQGRQSQLFDASKDKDRVVKLRSSVLAEAYGAGDELAVEVLHEAADFLGVGVGNLITLLGPSVAVLGGGVMEAMGAQLVGRVRDAARAVAFPESAFRDTRIELAALGDDAVALGAVALARQSLGRH